MALAPSGAALRLRVHHRRPIFGPNQTDITGRIDRQGNSGDYRLRIRAAVKILQEAWPRRAEFQPRRAPCRNDPSGPIPLRAPSCSLNTVFRPPARFWLDNVIVLSRRAPASCRRCLDGGRQKRKTKLKTGCRHVVAEPCRAEKCAPSRQSSRPAWARKSPKCPSEVPGHRSLNPFLRRAAPGPQHHVGLPAHLLLTLTTRRPPSCSGSTARFCRGFEAGGLRDMG